MKILGIVNVTRDSFSDGGRFLQPAAAIAHARRLLADGADIIDVGAESTHPAAQDVSADEEIARLTPVVQALKAQGAAVSIDTFKPAVMRAMAPLGVDFINDVTALVDAESIDAVRAANCRLILMHAVRGAAEGGASGVATGRAQRGDSDASSIVDRILAFFHERIASLESAGIVRERLILDPGMGFFLGGSFETSLAVLRHLPRLRELKCPLLVCTSRKSFIGALLGSPDEPAPVDQRAAGTLATELWAAHHGVEFIRTHDAGALRDAWRVWSRISDSQA